MNLIFKFGDITPNYWCTWSNQSYAVEVPVIRENMSEGFDGFQGFKTTQDNIDENRIFGENGWAVTEYPSVRHLLYFMFDQGWDMELNLDEMRDRWRVSSLYPNEERFPAFRGTPVEKLTALNNRLKELGWRGAGLWVAAQAYGEGNPSYNYSDAKLEEFFAERARWSREAGIEYWKVDWGTRAHSAEFRHKLTQIAKKYAPDIIVEHAWNISPLNDNNAPWNNDICAGTGRFSDWGNGIPESSVEVLNFSDAFRTYDVTEPLAAVTTLDRVGFLMKNAKIKPHAKGLLNCEDELYLAAALGLTMGVMRSGKWYQNDSAVLPTRERIDEVARALRWQLTAPAFGLTENEISVSGERLDDNWSFREGETWADWVIGTTVKQSAPAYISRGMPLPKVLSEGEKPFVVCSKHPNGAIAVATIFRALDRLLGTPPADITIEGAGVGRNIGVFGHYNSLTVCFNEDITNHRVMAQDLLLDEAQDITEKLDIYGNRLKITGALIEEIGTSGKTAEDNSQPGLVLRLL